jgi:hypothetical protein
VVGDYFKSDADVLDYTDRATDLITWLRSKTYLLALLRDAQVQASKPILSVIRAVLTRWTAHYLAYRRLLQLQPTLTSMVYSDENRPENQRQIVRGDAKAKAKSLTMIEIIKTPTFWYALARYFYFIISFCLKLTLV